MLPLLLVATAPLLVTTFAFNFNNYTLIELLTGGGPFPGTLIDGGSTDLLINFTYRKAFNETNQQLGLASAIAMLIFVIVGTVSAYGFRLTRRLEEIGTMSTETTSPTPETAVKAERMPFGRWLRLVGWRHARRHRVRASGRCSRPSTSITLAFSGGNTLTAACPPEQAGPGGAQLHLPARRSRPRTSTTLLTSDQWPFAIVVPEHADHRDASTPSPRCSWAPRRRSRSAGCGSRAAGWACSR